MLTALVTSIIITCLPFNAITCLKRAYLLLYILTLGKLFNLGLRLTGSHLQNGEKNPQVAVRMIHQCL